mmetsp:Transcript_10696/g.33261  ORF Transcript_10696/g.33261 Transcript_10696/m.33261 type:complete len:268 (-) Transcript_10696:1416-2219(-)
MPWCTSACTAPQSGCPAGPWGTWRPAGRTSCWEACRMSTSTPRTTLASPSWPSAAATAPSSPTTFPPMHGRASTANSRPSVAFWPRWSSAPAGTQRAKLAPQPRPRARRARRAWPHKQRRLPLLLLPATPPRPSPSKVPSCRLCWLPAWRRTCRCRRPRSRRSAVPRRTMRRARSGQLRLWPRLVASRHMPRGCGSTSRSLSPRSSPPASTPWARRQTRKASGPTSRPTSTAMAGRPCRKRRWSGSAKVAALTRRCASAPPMRRGPW